MGIVRSRNATSIVSLYGCNSDRALALPYVAGCALRRTLAMLGASPVQQQLPAVIVSIPRFGGGLAGGPIELMVSRDARGPEWHSAYGPSREPSYVQPSSSVPMATHPKRRNRWGSLVEARQAHVGGLKGWLVSSSTILLAIPRFR